MSIIITPSGTSTVNTASPSSSAQQNPAETVTAQTLPVPTASTSNQPENKSIPDWLINTVVGGVIGGVLGFSATIYVVKDNINENKTEISIARRRY